MNRCDAHTIAGRRCRNSRVNGLNVCGIHSDECVICFHRLGFGKSLVRTSCGHLFHGPCINRWLGCSNRCPICRYKLQRSVVTVYDLCNVVVDRRRIIDILTRVEDLPEHVTLTMESNILLLSDHNTGTLITSEPFSL